MANCFEAQTADAVWREAASMLVRHDNTLKAESRLGATHELLHCVLSIQNPKARWILSRLPALNPAFAIVESLWILAGRRDAQLVNYWNPALPKFGGNGETYHGAYGYRLRSHFGIDQLARAYETLKVNPSSRQVVMQIWDPAADLPAEDGSPVASDIPCNVSSLLKIREGRLDWLQVMRSNDIFLGTPYNIVQFTLVQEIVAGWLGVGVGNYTLVTDSLHLYQLDEDLMRIGIEDAATTKGYALPALGKNEFDSVLARIVRNLELMATTDLDRPSFLKICEDGMIPQGYRNLLVVAAADAARRRGWTSEERHVIGICEDPALQRAYQRWAERKGGPAEVAFQQSRY